MAKFMMSCPDPLLALTDEFIDGLREQTGLKLTRSGLAQILFGILIKAAGDMETATIYDDETLRDSIVKAICSKYCKDI